MLLPVLASHVAHKRVDKDQSSPQLNLDASQIHKVGTLPTVLSEAITERVFEIRFHSYNLSLVSHTAYSHVFY